MSFIDSATTAAASVATSILTAPANALSGIKDAISGVLGFAGSTIQNLSGISLPGRNPLHAYATYNYILSLGCLSDNEINYPDSTYISGKPPKLICKSAGIDPENRVSTEFGKFDFYIERLEIKTTGIGDGHNTNVTQLDLVVVEPYGMGSFVAAMQKAAKDLGHENFLNDAPFIVIIEFKGNTEDGKMESIPNTTRYIPITLSQIDLTVTEQGSVYNLLAVVYNDVGLADRFNSFQTDVSAKGKTVQEVLQTGEKSIQAAKNRYYKELVERKLITTPDEIVILFPEDNASAATAGSSADSTAESDAGATTQSSSDSSGIYQKLGVSRSSKNETLVQQEGMCNVLGKAKLGFDDARAGDAPYGNDNEIWSDSKKVYERSKNSIDPEMCDFRFRQDSSVINAINQVLLTSDFAAQALDSSQVSPEGFRTWWKVDIQRYPLPKANESTGIRANLVVYRVIPYLVHASTFTTPNTKVPGFSALLKQAPREYNYIYTGKNDDILDMKLSFKNLASTLMADGNLKNQDLTLTESSSDAIDDFSVSCPLSGGSLPGNTPNFPTSVLYNSSMALSDKRGGGGLENSNTRAARLFMDAVTNGPDLQQLDLTIVGDPYFIIASGVGNYTAKRSQYINLNADGSMNHQDGEVDVIVNFRTPIDIDQSTGMYDLNGETSILLQYSGAYKVVQADHYFEHGEFKQLLKLNRRPQQENPTESTLDKSFNVSNAGTIFSDLFGSWF